MSWSKGFQLEVINCSWIELYLVNPRWQWRWAYRDSDTDGLRLRSLVIGTPFIFIDLGLFTGG